MYSRKIVAEDGWVIVPLTRIFLPNDYVSAREDAISFLMNAPGVCSVVEYGSVSPDGMSDLDLIVGMADPPPPRASSIVRKERLPSRVLDVLDYASLMIMP